MRVAARRVLLADGGAITTDAGEDCCWASEEVSAVDVEVEEGTLCDICGERILGPIPAGTVLTEDGELLTYDEARMALEEGWEDSVECGHRGDCPRECPNYEAEEDES